MALASFSNLDPRPAGPAVNLAGVVPELEVRGFALVAASVMRQLLGEPAAPDEEGFAASWNDLPLDEFMADGGRYRRRRYAVFTAEGNQLRRQPHQPHYQTLRHNPLNGGVARWFAPVRDDVADGPTLRSGIRALTRTADERRGTASPWRVEVHQFRIESRGSEAGRPTPEGMHRDGVDFVLAALIARSNVADGVSTISDPAGTPLARVQLAERFDSMVLEDSRVRHGVSPIRAIDPACPAFRDVLVVTLTAARA